MRVCLGGTNGPVECTATVCDLTTAGVRVSFETYYHDEMWSLTLDRFCVPFVISNKTIML